MQAVTRGHHKVVKTLLKAGANVHHRDDVSGSPGRRPARARPPRALPITPSATYARLAISPPSPPLAVGCRCPLLPDLLDQSGMTALDWADDLEDGDPIIALLEKASGDFDPDDGAGVDDE
jgi:hypothetical protein